MALPRPPIQDKGVEEVRENHCDGPCSRSAGLQCWRGMPVYREPAVGRPLNWDAKINQIEGTIVGIVLRRTRLVPTCPLTITLESE